VENRIPCQGDREEPLAFLFIITHLGPAWSRSSSPDDTDDISKQTFAAAGGGCAYSEKWHIAHDREAADEGEHGSQCRAQVPGLGKEEVSDKDLQTAYGCPGVVLCWVVWNPGEFHTV